MTLVVFDLDGTIIDSRRDLADSTNELLESLGAARLPDEDVVAMIGEGARVLVKRALTAARVSGVPLDDALTRFRDIYDRRLLVHTRLYDGVAAAIAGCSERGVAAVLTNKPESPSRKLLDAFALTRHFQTIVGGDSGFARKPDPVGLLHIMQIAGCSAAETLMVGDSWIDVETAQRAGVPMCGVEYGFGAASPRGLTGATWTIAAPADLLPLLDRFRERH